MKKYNILQFGYTLSWTAIAKQLVALLFLSAVGYSSIAQSTNYRAQGNYYSAKSNLKSGNYSVALDYINKSKTALGGTNEQLQYLHILAAYRLDKFDEAKKEMETFFDITENKLKPVWFDKSVDRLTDDETRELTILMDPIFESADKKKNHPCKKCSGTGKATVTKLTEYHCNSCGEKDRGGYLVNYNSEFRKTQRGYQTREEKGYTKTVCTICNGKGMEICSKCEGLSTNKCKGCTENPVYPSGLHGFSFYCGSCSGNGNKFTICTVCKGTKTYTTSSPEKITCNDCNGRGF